MATTQIDGEPSDGQSRWQLSDRSIRTIGQIRLEGGSIDVASLTIAAGGDLSVFVTMARLKLGVINARENGSSLVQLPGMDIFSLVKRPLWNLAVLRRRR